MAIQGFLQAGPARRRMRHLVHLAAALLVLTLLLPWAAAPAQAASTITRVMTRNMDRGTDFTPLLAAATPADFVKAVTAVYNEVQASNVPERAAGVAREIAANEPDLVSLQEVDLWRTGPSGSGPATTVRADALASLQSALAALGLHYAPIAIAQEFDLQAPSTLVDPVPLDVRVTDRDVILARTGLSAVTYANVQTGQYAAVLSVPTPVGPVSMPQGWASVDVTNRGHTFRFIATHLSVVPPIQDAQALQLVGGPGHTALPAVFAGDFNTAASGGPDVSRTYPDLLAAGLIDAWNVANPGVAGYTWPLHGEDPYTPSATPTERFDLVFTHGAIGVGDVILFGNTVQSQTPSGLWPSDHAGVQASLKFSS